MRFRETLTLLLVLIITLSNVLRLWTALAWRAALEEFAGAGSLTILALGGAVWSLAGFFAAWALLARRRWARHVLAGLSIAYSLWYWAERLLRLAPSPNWAFAAIANFVLLAFVMTNVKLMAREEHERENQHPKTA